MVAVEPLMRRSVLPRSPRWRLRRSLLVGLVVSCRAAARYLTQPWQRATPLAGRRRLPGARTRRDGDERDPSPLLRTREPAPFAVKVACAGVRNDAELGVGRGRL